MEERITPESPSPSGIQPIPLPLFAVQLQNILPVEIVARRFPEGDTTTPPEQLHPPNAQLNIGEPEFNTEIRQAQVLMEVKVDPVEEPRLFEISVKIIGIFSYSPDYSLESVRQFLRQGSLSVLLPSARELLLSLSTRLQLPLIVLPLIQLTPLLYLMKKQRILLNNIEIGKEVEVGMKLVPAGRSPRMQKALSHSFVQTIVGILILYPDLLAIVAELLQTYERRSQDGLEEDLEALRINQQRTGNKGQSSDISPN